MKFLKNVAFLWKNSGNENLRLMIFVEKENVSTADAPFNFSACHYLLIV